MDGAMKPMMMSGTQKRISCPRTDDDERDAEENQLSEDVADRDDDVHERDARELSDRDTCDDAEQQLHGQAG